jgi:bifunctional enzyme CysN/CysC
MSRRTASAAPPAGARARLRLVVLGQAGDGESMLLRWLRSETDALRAAARDCELIAAPDDGEVLRDLATEASDAALLPIGAVEGLSGEARRHAQLLSLFAMPQLVVVIDGMDLVGYDGGRFGRLERKCRDELARLGLAPAQIVPISSREAVNLAAGQKAMPWYEGPSLLATLASLRPAPPLADLPLRMVVQDVHEREGRHIVLGRVESGRLALGDELLFSPSNKAARLRGIEVPNAPAPPRQASAGDSIAVVLDERIFVERGELVSHRAKPPIETNVFRARIVWQGARPLRAGARLALALHAASAPVEVQAIESAVDAAGRPIPSPDRVERHAVAEVVLRSRALLTLDAFTENPRTGRLVLLEDGLPVGGGVIGMEGYPDQRELVTVRATNVSEVAHRVGHEARESRAGHRGGVLWFTGLSGAGKSTLAMEVEQRLFAKGYNVYVLDGDNVRRGLSANLGFSADDRAENIRRIGEVAALFADAGFICISAFISPYRSDRERARRAAGGKFHEVYVKADLGTCERRDPKGLYRRARAGEIKEFTGISAPYEPPDSPELIVDTGTRGVEDCVAEIIAYVERGFALAPRGK